MPVSICRSSVLAAPRRLAVRLIACGAVLAVAGAAACQGPTEPVQRPSRAATKATLVPLGVPAASAMSEAASTDSAVSDTVPNRPNGQLIWW